MTVDSHKMSRAMLLLLESQIVIALPLLLSLGAAKQGTESRRYRLTWNRKIASHGFGIQTNVASS